MSRPFNPVEFGLSPHGRAKPTKLQALSSAPQPSPVMPSKAGTRAFLLDSRQSLSPQALDGEHAGTVFWDNKHFIPWSRTKIQSSSYALPHSASAFLPNHGVPRSSIGI
jgi:hypothetical protein